MLGHPTRHFQVCGSTNDEAARWAAEGAPHGAAVRADAQTDGRGRQGRSWNSPGGRGLYISYILRPQLELCAVAQLTVVAVVAAAHALEALTGRVVSTKWPNDIVLGDHKIGGLLCEASGAGGVPAQVATAIIGIGLNINFERDDLPPAPKIAASSLLLETGRRWDLEDAAALLSVHLETELQGWAKGGWDGVRQEFAERDILQGKTVTVDAAPASFEGIARGVDSDGALLVATAGGTRRVVAGDVRLRAAF